MNIEKVNILNIDTVKLAMIIHRQFKIPLKASLDLARYIKRVYDLGVIRGQVLSKNE